MHTDLWYCPAMDKDINEGLCWEYCFADNGGPADTANELRKWIEETNRFIDIKDFHEVCENCVYCQWGR